MGNTIKENNKPCCSRETTRLDEIQKYSEQTLPVEFTNDDNQASDRNKQDSDDSTNLQNLAEQQMMPKKTQEPELPTLPEQKKKQEPAMKALKKCEKNEGKQKSQTTIRSRELCPETDEEKNETKWTKGEKIKEESEEPNETDSSTITDLPRRRGRSRQRTDFYGQNVMVTRISKTTGGKRK